MCALLSSTAAALADPQAAPEPAPDAPAETPDAPASTAPVAPAPADTPDAPTPAPDAPVAPAPAPDAPAPVAPAPASTPETPAPGTAQPAATPASLPAATPPLGAPYPAAAAVPLWLRSHGEADPKLQAGVATAAIGAAAISGGLLLLGDGLSRRPDCTPQICSTEDGTFETTMGVAMLTAGLTQAAFSTALLTAHTRQGPVRLHRSTGMAASGATLTSLATGALIGGASGWLQSSFDQAGDELVPPLLMVASGALLLPIGLPLWFAGSGAPTELEAAIEPDLDTKEGREQVPLDGGPQVMRNPAMAALGGGLSALGGLGVVATIGTTVVVVSDEAPLDSDTTLFHITALGTASLGLLSVGLPMLVLGMEEVPAALAHARGADTLPAWAPNVSLGAGAATLQWPLQ